MTTFALRFRVDVDLGDWEQNFGDLDYCEYFEQPTYPTSQGNAPDVRYFTATLSDFVCLEGGEHSVAPTLGNLHCISFLHSIPGHGAFTQFESI